MTATCEFADTLTSVAWEDSRAALAAVRASDVERALRADRLGARDLPVLLAPAADAFLEDMASRARALTLMRFGRAVVLYVPVYVSSACVNSCLYCGFRRENAIARRTLSIPQVEQEMAHLRAEGFAHLLLVSGEHPGEMPLEYVERVVALAHERFASVSVEIYPLDEAGYRRLVAAGSDGLALYQETYDRVRYERMHPAGPKRDFDRRLGAPEAGAAAGMRSLGLGALLGLSDWRTEGIFLGRHAASLARRYWRSRIAFSFPRLCPAAGGFAPPDPVSDRDFVHLMCALRLAFPDAEIVVSTREPAAFRDALIRFGVATRYSAGSATQPGGYTFERSAEAQFAVHDTRPPAQVARVIAEAGYDPVWKDWDAAFLS